MIEVRWYPSGATGPEVLAEGELPAALADKDGLVWIDLTDPRPESVAVLVEQLGIHALAAEDIEHAGQRVKLDRYDDHIHLAAYEVDVDGADLATSEIDFLVADGWLVTARRPMDGTVGSLVTEAAGRFERTLLLGNPVDEAHLLHALLDTLVDRYVDLAERLRARLDTMEATVFTAGGGGGDVQRQLYILRRSLVGFTRLAAPLGDAVAAILRGEIGTFHPDAKVHLQDVHDHVVRTVDDLQFQREILDAALQAHLALASNRMSEVMERMTAWGAILISATLVAGIYGMNFEHMPELEWWFGYPLALGLMVAVGATLHRRFKRRGWL